MLSLNAFKALIGSTVLEILLVGCGHNIPPLGHLEGSLLELSNQGELNTLPVGIDISLPEAKVGQTLRFGKVRISHPQGDVITTLDISTSNPRQFTLKIPVLREEPFKLVEAKVDTIPNSKIRNIKCFQDTRKWSAEFCFDPMEFHLQILDPSKKVVFKLFGNTFSKEPPFPMEPQTTLSVQEAIQRAFESNLDSKINFEHVIQAKNLVLANYLNLIPHLTTNLIWNQTFGYVSAIATLQGLVPFLLPTYYLQAKESEWDLKIKADAEIIQRADLAAMVEQLSYAYARDRKIASIQELAIQTVLEFQKALQDLESSGKLKSGSSTSLEKLLHTLASDSTKTAQLILDEQYALSQALGFHNPGAVAEITLSDDLPHGTLPPLVKEDLAPLVSRRSFELQQLDFLREIGKLKKIELYFNWIDPTGDPKTSLGFNTIPQLKVSDSQIHELELKREQLKMAIYQNAYRIADEYNSAIQYWNNPKTRSGTVNTAASLSSVLQQCLSPNDFNRDLAMSQILELLSNEIGDVANATEVRIAQSKLNRALLRGYFEFLLPHLGEITPGGL